VPELAPALPSRLPPPSTLSPSGFCSKLQKLENWKNISIEDLLGEAQKVYVRREEEKQKQKAKIMSSTIKQVNRERPNQYPIGPQPAQPPSWGIRDQKVRR
jgi:hypothetical protein